MEKRKPDDKISITIIGTGLIGCSMAEGLRSLASEITGVDTSSAHLQQALSRGIIDRCSSLENALMDASLVLITAPVDATIDLLPSILDNTGSQAVVIDAGSVKGAICDSVAGHPARKRFVAAHPMAGLAVSGPDAADARMFRDRSVIVCEHEKSSPRAMDTASTVFGLLGMHMIFMSPSDHDVRVARISHLPQVISYCLCALAAAGNQEDLRSLAAIASTGFESSTRLASSSPDMWIPIFRTNREKLSASLEEMISILAETREMINGERWGQVKGLIEKANSARKSFLAVNRVPG
jgi:prephenate dehydrogenase